MKRKIMYAFAVLIFISLLMVVFWGRSNKSKPKSYDHVMLRLSWLPQSQYAGFYVANDQGFYKEEKLEVEILSGSYEANAIKLVASGSETFGLSSGDEFLFARNKGLPIVAVASVFQKNILTFFAKRESAINKPEDFIGHKVGILPGRSVEIVYKALMKKLGIDRSKINEVNVQFDMTPFFNGEVDVWNGYIINEPLIAREKGLNIVEIRPEDYGVPLYGDVIFASQATIENNPDMVKRFLRATFKGWQWTIEHPEDAVSIAMKHMENPSKEHETAMLKETIKLIQSEDTVKNGLGWMDKNKWQSIIQFLYDQGELEKVDLGEFYTTNFLK